MDTHKPLLTAEKLEQKLTAAITASLEADDAPRPVAVDEFADEFLLQEPRSAE
jgi:hypothetical protein